MRSVLIGVLLFLVVFTPAGSVIRGAMFLMVGRAMDGPNQYHYRTSKDVVAAQRGATFQGRMSYLLRTSQVPASTREFWQCRGFFGQDQKDHLIVSCTDPAEFRQFCKTCSGKTPEEWETSPGSQGLFGHFNLEKPTGNKDFNAAWAGSRTARSPRYFKQKNLRICADPDSCTAYFYR